MPQDLLYCNPLVGVGNQDPGQQVLALWRHHGIGREAVVDLTVRTMRLQAICTDGKHHHGVHQHQAHNEYPADEDLQDALQDFLKAPVIIAVCWPLKRVPDAWTYSFLIASQLDCSHTAAPRWPGHTLRL
jgi:hypothetical protein